MSVDQQHYSEKQPSKHLLILSLSTGDLNKMKETVYRSPDADGTLIQTSGYQLEPVPKYLAETVGLDGILMIETEKTEEIEEYFKNWLCNITNIRGKFSEQEIIEYRLKDADKATLLDVNIIVSKIQDYVKKEKADVTIYLDLHGGPRVNAEIMTSLFSLLPMERLEGGRQIYIDPANIYSVTFDKNNPETNKIIKAGDGYQLMDLIAGVHEFVEYGRTESLKRYASHHNEIESMVRAMDTISNGLAMANIDEFNNGLRNLKNELLQDQTEGTEENQIEGDASDILIRLVWQEYRSLFFSRSKQINKIRWCKNKKFYQLAITLCEAKIPYVLMNQGGNGTFDFSRAIANGYGQSGNRRRTRVNEEFFLGAFNFFVTSCKLYEGSGSTIYYGMQWREDHKYYYLECDRNADGLVEKFLQLHVNIKATRNAANHVSAFDRDNRRNGRVVTIYSTTQQLDRAIEEYLETVSKLKNERKVLELKIAAQKPW